MERLTIHLKDGKGGLNNTNPPNELKPDEFSVLQNYLTDDGGFLKKRPGCTSIQGVLINPTQVDPDASTLALWHLDEATGGPWADSSIAGANTLSAVSPNFPDQVSGMFPTGTPFAASFVGTGARGTPVIKKTSASLDGLSAVTFDTWINIDSSFNGVLATDVIWGNVFSTSNSGACLVGTAMLSADGNGVGSILNGLTINQDNFNGQDVGAPYVNFILNLNGLSTPQTIRTQMPLAKNKVYHIRGSYDSATGKMSLWVNGDADTSVTLLGAGTINDVDSQCLALGGCGIQLADVNLQANQNWIPGGGDIYGMAVSGDTLFVCGDFTAFMGQPRKYIAAVDIPSGTLLPWQPLYDSAPLLISALKVYGTTLYAGGFDSGTSNNLFAFDISNGSLIWSADAARWIEAIESDGTNIYVGGIFTSIKDSAGAINAVSNLCSLNATTGVFNAAFTAGTNGEVTTIKIYSGDIYFGGGFSVAAGSTRNGAFSLDASTYVLSTFDPEITGGGVYDLDFYGNTVYAVGTFSQVNGGAITRPYAASFDSVAGTATAWNTNLDGSVFSVVSTAGGVYLAGYFRSISIAGQAPLPRYGITQVDHSSGTVTGLTLTSSNGNLFLYMLLYKNELLAAGRFNGNCTAWAFALNVYQMFQGWMDEVSISTVARSTFPFAQPRGQGFEFAKSDGTKQWLIAAGTGLFYTLGDGVWHQMTGPAGETGNQDTGAPFSTTAYWDMRQFGDIMYMGNGVDKNYAWDGQTLAPWGEGITPLVITPTIDGYPGTLNGFYDWFYTVLYGDSETGPSPIVSAHITGPNNAATVTDIPVRHANCSGIRIWRKVNGADILTATLIREVANGVTALTGNYNNGGSPSLDTGCDANLSPTDTRVIDATVAGTSMPILQYLCAEQDRVFGIGPDRPFDYRWSELGVPDVITVYNFGRAKAQAGPLIAIYSYYGEIHISKGGRATLVLKGDNPNNWSQAETTHPDIGCIDHWGVVYRTIPGQSGQTDTYTICIPAKDGFYEYAGFRYTNISNLKILKTIQGLAATNSTRNDALWTTETQFEAALKIGGSATPNVSAPSYGVDGTREVSGQVKIVNQLDYIPLAGGGSPTSLPGPVLAICPGAADEEFYFSCMNATAYAGSVSAIYHTTDNFRTWTARTWGWGAYVIEIIRAVVAGSEYLFFATGDINDSGNVWRWKTGDVQPTMVSGTMIWQVDIPFGFIGRAKEAVGSPIYGYGNGNNFYINFSQSVYFTTTGYPNIFGGLYPYGVNIFGPGTSPYQLTLPLVGGGNGPNFVYNLNSGFYSLYNNGDTTMFIQRREVSNVNGGTFKPQMVFDDVNQKLYFLGKGGVAVPRGIACSLWEISSVFTNPTVANKSTTQVVTALGKYSDGITTTIYYTENKNSSTLIPTGNFNGTIPTLNHFNPASGGIATVDLVAQFGLVPFRLFAGVAGKIVLGGKYFENEGSAITIPVNDYDHAGTFAVVSATGGNLFNSMSMGADGYAGAAYPQEMAYQTDSPNKLYVVTGNCIKNQQIWLVDLTALTASLYFADAPPMATGVMSNLVFRPASGAANNNYWADRLYWSTAAAFPANDSLVQIGVPGNWTCIGVYTSEIRDLGAIGSLDDFNVIDAGLPGQIQFYIGNGTASPLTFLPQTPNDKILSFPKPGPLVQWRAQITWAYDSSHTTSPSLSYIEIFYYLGLSTVPRIVGRHYQGRSFWALANNGDTANSFVLLYDKKNAWGIIQGPGWALQAIGVFRNQFVGMAGNNFVQLMTGQTDIGTLIVGNAVTGYQGDEPRDLCLDHIRAMVMSWANKSGNSGFIKISTYNKGVKADADWVCPLPGTGNGRPMQVTPLPFKNDQSFLQNGWARMWAIGISTSQDESGPYIAPVDQIEDIAELYLRCMHTMRYYDPQVP